MTPNDVRTFEDFCEFLPSLGLKFTTYGGAIRQFDFGVLSPAPCPVCAAVNHLMNTAYAHNAIVAAGIGFPNMNVSECMRIMGAADFSHPNNDRVALLKACGL